MTLAGTSNELDVQNEWEENTHTNTELYQEWGSEVHKNWSMVIPGKGEPVTVTTLRTTDWQTRGRERHRYAIVGPDKLGTDPMAVGGINYKWRPSWKAGRMP